jgi:hypothetical protein
MKQEVSLNRFRIRKGILRWENQAGTVTFTNDKMQIEGYDQRDEEFQMGTLRVRKNTDEWERNETKRKVVRLCNVEIIKNALKKQDKKINDRRSKAAEETEEVEEDEERNVKEQIEERKTEKRKGVIIDKRSINSDEDEDGESENQPTLIDIIRKEEDKGYQKGNKPRIARTRYQERREEIPKEELRSNVASTFISHNFNKDKWWNDPQIKKEEWKTKNLTKYILSKSAETFHTIQEIREEQPSKAMKMIQRIMMQMHSRTRNTNTEEEEMLIDYKGWLCLEALKIQAPIGSLRTVKLIMKSI